MRYLYIQLLIAFSLAISPANAFEQQPEGASKKVSRQVITAQDFMAVTANRYATEAAYDVLKREGNAVDAAIAAQMVLNVVEPQSSGIGGGAFLLYYDAKQKTIYAYDGRETAPAEAKPDMFLDKQGKQPPFFDAVKGGLSVGTPGLLKMLAVAHTKFGKVPWDELFTHAITLAKKGFPLSPRLHDVAAEAEHYKGLPKGAELIFNPDGSVKPVGTVVKNPALAETFSTIAVEGIAPFYQGDIAADIVKAVRNNPIKPGTLNAVDLVKYQPKLREPLCGYYHSYKVCGMGPPSSGTVAVLQVLGILEMFDVQELEPLSTMAIHLISEAERLAYADRNQYIGDSDFIEVPVNEMLDESYLASRAKLISKTQAMKEVKPGTLLITKLARAFIPQQEAPSTTHISIIDKEGNAVSMTSSIEQAFGSTVMARGFLLNNQMTDFSFVPEVNGVAVANRIEPGKRPRSSMTPLLVFDAKGKLVMVLGSPGGARIIPFVLNALIGVLDWHMNMQEAVNKPHHLAISDAIELEEGTILEKRKPELEKMGHQVRIMPLTSGVHGIWVQGDKLIAGVDPRREGSAMGE